MSVLVVPLCARSVSVLAIGKHEEITYDAWSNHVAVMSIKPLPTPLVSYVLKLPDTVAAAKPGGVESRVQAFNGWSTVPTQVASKRGIGPPAVAYVGPDTVYALRNALATPSPRIHVL